MAESENPQKRTALVTGGGSGIGRAVCAALAARDVEVLLVARTGAAAEAARASFPEHLRGHIVPFGCDLSMLQEVRQFAEAVNAAYPSLDLLVNAAGVQPWTRKESAEGVELTWATNVLAPFLLTKLLVPGLTAAGGGCVINIGSVVHRWGSIDWDDIEKMRKYDPNEAYYQSKLAFTMLTAEFASRYGGSAIQFLAMEPGMTRTDFARDFRGFYRFMSRLYRPFMRTPEAVAIEVADLFERPLSRADDFYFYRGKPGRLSPKVHDAELRQKLWQVCQTYVERLRGSVSLKSPIKA